MRRISLGEMLFADWVLLKGKLIYLYRICSVSAGNAALHGE